MGIRGRQYHCDHCRQTAVQRLPACFCGNRRHFRGSRSWSLYMSKIEVYSTAVCPYCVAAKNLLKAKGLSWEDIRVDTDPAQRDAMLARSGGRRTVPQIFVNDQLVGGYDDLVAAERSGKLAELLGETA